MVQESRPSHGISINGSLAMVTIYVHALLEIDAKFDICHGSYHQRFPGGDWKVFGRRS